MTTQANKFLDQIETLSKDLRVEGYHGSADYLMKAAKVIEILERADSNEGPTQAEQGPHLTYPKCAPR